jgi:L-aspartate oxidase
MWERVGILRSRASLERALREFEEIARAPLRPAPRNFLTAATLIARSALWREESRGGHFRVDFPARDDERWRAHSVIRQDAEIFPADEVNFSEVNTDA